MVNVVLHIVCGLVFYALILRGFGGRDAPAIRLAAFCGALLWLVHSLNSRPLTRFTLALNYALHGLAHRRRASDLAPGLIGTEEAGF